jgi:hypothetical protein
VHPAVADGVDRPAFHLAARPVGARVLRELEAMALTARLGDDEHAEPAVRLAAIRIGARQQHQHVGPCAERAPCLHAVDHIARLVARPGGRCRCHLDTGDVAAVVGFGDGDCGHRFCGRQLR